MLEPDEQLRPYCRDTAAAMSVACCLARASQGLGSLFHFRHGALASPLLLAKLLVCAGALGSPNKALCGTSNTEW